ncbi:hypothetical protein ACH4UM_35270 [Streptomyces sp. NPDC020801]|uniref:hypothetical protein n=1 Tax=unclassified Streptomyces TaxID=2593676 RepID=UPI0037B3F8D9
MKIDPDLQDIERFVAEWPGEPVVVLNLPRFREGGAEKYADHLRHALPYAEAAA